MICNVEKQSTVLGIRTWNRKLYFAIAFSRVFYQSSLDISLTSIFISISHLHEINKCLTLKISWRLKCEFGGNLKLFPFLFNLLNLELHHFMI